jgi:hypothetical protein
VQTCSTPYWQGWRSEIPKTISAKSLRHFFNHWFDADAEDTYKDENKLLRGNEMEEQICYGKHSGHVCVLAMYKKFEEIKAVTQHPKYICFNCGRVADSEDNLCNPKSIK